jgi:perosamine synthetase
MNIPISEPFLNGNEKKYVDQCMNTSWISSQGEFIPKFEEALANYHGIKYAVATSNCTSALHLALKSLNIGLGDEVICPDLTFIAPANMIVLSGAKLVLVDVNPSTLAINPKLIEAAITERTKAIIVVHQFGHAAPMDEILSIAQKNKLYIIEDNAESIGGKYKGKMLGTIGDVSCYSFFANKIITTGEGGAILTKNSKIAEKCRTLRDHGMSLGERYHHVDLGYNYRMTNIQAAIGLAQIEELDNILALRRKQMDIYYDLLKDTEGIFLRSFKEWCEPVHWMMTITLDRRYKRDQILINLREKGVDCRQMINPVHQAEHFKNQFNDKNFPNSIKISHQSLHLPCSTGLKENQIKFIVDSLRQSLDQVN